MRSLLEQQVSGCVSLMVNKKILLNDRLLLKHLELDIVIPELRLAIEVNGDLWHSDAAITHNTEYESARAYHIHKLKEAKKMGFKLLFVWEYDWITRRKEVIAALKKAFNGGVIDSILQQYIGPRNSLYSYDEVLDAIEGVSCDRVLSSALLGLSFPARKLLTKWVVPTLKKDFYLKKPNGKELMALTDLNRETVVEAWYELFYKRVLFKVNIDTYVVSPQYLVTEEMLERYEITAL